MTDFAMLADKNQSGVMHRIESEEDKIRSPLRKQLGGLKRAFSKPIKNPSMNLITMSKIDSQLSI